MGIVYEDCYHYLLKLSPLLMKNLKRSKNFTSFSENFTSFFKNSTNFFENSTNFFENSTNFFEKTKVF
jgi:hypothetical protein